MRENYDHKLAAHPGIKATLLRIRENWTWDRIRKDVKRYVQNCQKCQRNTQEIHKGLLAEIQRPRKIWKLVAMDHITKLPPVKGLDAILVIVNRYSERRTSFRAQKNRPLSRSGQIAGKMHGNYTDYHKK